MPMTLRVGGGGVVFDSRKFYNRALWRRALCVSQLFLHTMDSCCSFLTEKFWIFLHSAWQQPCYLYSSHRKHSFHVISSSDIHAASVATIYIIARPYIIRIAAKQHLDIVTVLGYSRSLLNRPYSVPCFSAVK